MKKELAFVLSGGGSRGALQVGALRALLEAGFQPRLVTGTSIGAVNAAFLSVNGFNIEGIQKLEEAWRTATTQDFLPANLWRQVMQVFFRRSQGVSQQRIREFAIGHGLTPDLRFKDIAGVKLFIVASDLNSNSLVVFGENAEDYVLESMMASIALPPWMFPVETEGRYLVDGGAVSNLPVEAALRQGAEEIIALDLFNPYEVATSERGLRPFLWKLNLTVENRQNQLEMELAEARGVPVHHISLTMEGATSFWDFQHSEKMMEHGYQITREIIETWEREDSGSNWRRFPLLSRLEGLLQMRK